MFQLDQRSKDLRTTTSGQRAPPIGTGRPARIVHNLASLGKRQRAQLHRPPPVAYDVLMPLHELWKRYADQVASCGKEATEELDLHGAEVVVVSSTTSSLVGCKVQRGLIMWHALNFSTMLIGSGGAGAAQRTGGGTARQPCASGAQGWQRAAGWRARLGWPIIGGAQFLDCLSLFIIHASFNSNCSMNKEPCEPSGKPIVQQHVLVFARLPFPGRVKRRLAASIGDQSAADVYQACAQHVITQASKLGTNVCHCTVWYAEPPSSHADVHTWLARTLPFTSISMPHLVR